MSPLAPTLHLQESLAQQGALREAGTVPARVCVGAEVAIVDSAWLATCCALACIGQGGGPAVAARLSVAPNAARSDVITSPSCQSSRVAQTAQYRGARCITTKVILAHGPTQLAWLTLGCD